MELKRGGKVAVLAIALAGLVCVGGAVLLQDGRQQQAGVRGAADEAHAVRQSPPHAGEPADAARMENGRREAGESLPLPLPAVGQETSGSSGPAAATREPGLSESDLPEPGLPERNLSKPDLPERTTYRIKLEFRPDDNRMDGESEVTVRNGADEPTSEMRFQLFLNAFDGQDGVEPVLPEFRKRAYPVGSAGGRMDVNGVTVNEREAAYRVDGTTLYISLDEPWRPGERRDVRIGWSAVLPVVHHRTGQSGDAYWFGNMLPILAVFDGEWRNYAYEAVGDPFFSQAADYRVEVVAPDGYAVVATGDESAATRMPDPDGRTKSVTVIDAPQVREFAFAVSPNHRLASASTRSGIAVNVYYRNASESRVRDTLRRATEMTEAAEARAGGYPYGEIDIFENEMFITGMEYPGIVFVRSDRLNSAAGYETVVHEIAHQWFYNIVGSNQIEEPWLDEGFATYLADEYIYGDRLDETYAAFRSRLGTAVRAGDVRSYDTWSSYYAANYRKSSLMLHALRGELGEEAFSAFVTAYVDAHRFGIATTNSLIRTAQSFAAEPLDDFFAEWLPGNRGNQADE